MRYQQQPAAVRRRRALLASWNAASMPSRMFRPSSCAGPLNAADCPNRMRAADTPGTCVSGAAADAAVPASSLADAGGAGTEESSRSQDSSPATDTAPASNTAAALCG